MIEITQRTIIAANSRALEFKASLFSGAAVSMADRFENVFAYKPIDYTSTLGSVKVFTLDPVKNVKGQPLVSEDARLHLALYRRFPQIRAVVHIRSPKVLSFCFSGESIPVLSKNHAINFGEPIENIPIEPEAEAGGDFSLPEILVQALEKKQVSSSGAVLLSSIGAVVWDETPMKAVELASCLERAAATAWNIRNNVARQFKMPCLPIPEVQARKYFEERQISKSYSEERGAPGTVVTRQQLRNINLGLLKYFDKVCRENGIKYSLTGGTLLGAVRHGGMIPWDDDVDVFLTRPEYDKLQTAFPDHERYEYVTIEKDPTFNYVFGRLIDKYTMVQSSLNNAAAGKGIGLDVCVVDGLPDSPLERKWHMKYMRLLVRFRRATIQEPNTLRYKEKGWFYILSKLIIRKVTDLHYWNKKMSKAMKKYPFDGGEFIGNFTSQYGKKEMMHRTVFDEYYDVPFENLTCMVCGGYNEYLKHIYKNYMKLPPKAKRQHPHIRNTIWV